MSIVPSTGILRLHYEQAIADIEYKSMTFWDALLQRTFPQNTYTVTSEFSRADLVVKRYDSNCDTVSASLWIECKRPSGSVSDVEAQALDAAQRCIRSDNLKWICVMTTAGVSFRLWYVSKDNIERLVPVHGDTARADLKQYINADSAEAAVFSRTIQQIASNYPLGDAPIVPSQPPPI